MMNTDSLPSRGPRPTRLIHLHLYTPCLDQTEHVPKRTSQFCQVVAVLKTISCITASGQQLPQPINNSTTHTQNKCQMYPQS